MTLGLVALLPAVALGWCVGGAPPARDGDDDGLNDIQEAYLGTNPGNPDSDGDGIPDGEEDLDQDGVDNRDEPTMFSLEIFEDPFASRSRRKVGVVIEGTNLFDPERRIRRAEVVFPGFFRPKRVSVSRRLHSSTRIYLRLNARAVARYLGSDLTGLIKIRTAIGETNTLLPIPMLCEDRAPHVMGAAVVQFKTRPDGNVRRYMVVGGCELLERLPRRVAATTVRFATHDLDIVSPYGNHALLPARLLIPMRSSAKPDPLRPFSDDIDVGDTIRIVTSHGVSGPAVVQGPVAELTIPPGNLDDDHDGDRLSTREELTLGTDPLVYDTDADGIADGFEVALGVTDPRDPDTDGDGTVDGRGSNATAVFRALMAH